MKARFGYSLLRFKKEKKKNCLNNLDVYNCTRVYGYNVNNQTEPMFQCTELLPIAI